MVIQNKNNIPEGWKKLTLQQCVDIDRNSLSEKTADNKNFFYIDLSAVSNGHITLPKEKVCFQDAPSRARRIIHKGDIIFSTVRPYLKGFALIDFNSNDYIVSTGFSVLTSKNSFSSKYIYHYLFSENFQKQIFISLLGSSFPALNSKDVQTLSILIPVSVKEQQKIVEVLETWDKAIQLTRKLIEQKELQKKYLMQQLLTGRTRLKGFTEKWKTTKLGKICSITTGRLDANAMVDFGQYKFFTCSKEVFFIDKFAFDTEALLISGNGNIGYIHYYKGKFNAYQRTYVLDSFSKNIFFTKYILELALPKRLAKETKVGSMPYIVLSTLRDMKLQYPSQKEQNAIAKILQKADKEIDLLRQKLNKLEEQKKGLMQILLTGKVRLNW